jgi:hypothetical protein
MAVKVLRPCTLTLEDVPGLALSKVARYGKLHRKKGAAAAVAAAAAAAATAADGSGSGGEEEGEEKEDDEEGDAGAGSVTGTGTSKEKVTVRCWLRLVPELLLLGYQVEPGANVLTFHMPLC